MDAADAAVRAAARTPSREMNMANVLCFREVVQDKLLCKVVEGRSTMVRESFAATKWRGN